MISATRKANKSEYTLRVDVTVDACGEYQPFVLDMDWGRDNSLLDGSLTETEFLSVCVHV